MSELMHRQMGKPEVLAKAQEQKRSYYSGKWNPIIVPVSQGLIVRLKNTPVKSIFQRSNVPDLFASKKLREGSLPFGVYDTNVEKLWQQDYTGKGIYCAIVDSGIDESHPDLKGKVYKSRSFLRMNDPRRHPHGTHVAGTVSANGFIKGVAPDSKLIDVRVLNSAGVGYDREIAKGLEWLVTLVKAGEPLLVVNMSLGGPQLNTDVKKAIATLTNLGVFVCCAAGNEGDGKAETSEFSYPAADRDTVSVAAYDARSQQIAPFSNSNPHVDCAAHGVDVLSTTLRGMYAVYDGTSMACPHVTGMACVLFQRLLKTRPEITPAQRLIEMKKQLLQWYTCDAGDAGKDNCFGFGIVRYKLPETAAKMQEGNNEKRPEQEENPE